MAHHPLTSLDSAGTAGAFRYLAGSVETSLFRNGKVLTRRDRDGSDAGTEGVLVDERQVTVHDARTLHGADARTLTAHGFELLRHPMAHPSLDFFDHGQVVSQYYPECAEIIRAHTGAARVFAFDHNVRSATGKKSQKRITGGQQVQGPAHIVHGDYTLTSAPQRLLDLTEPPRVNDTLASVLPPGKSLLERGAVEKAVAEGGRFAIINLWRNIVADPVAVYPLALCDGRTVQPDQLVVFEIHYHDRIGENYFAKYATTHEWYYYPNMVREEALLIKQWDSAGELARSRGARADAAAADPHAPCTFSFHSAFDDPLTPPDAPDRWSIEVRCAVLYE
ncbi:MAG: hypothetical protein GC151_17915 [Betaproteobacteria bacterium]|nr:hypothetical protein [Betaproteobacteria bacterium]